MTLFSRDKKATIAELEEYYENQRNNRSGRAWFMALISLFITVGVVAGLYFGGRWTYRALTNDDSQPTAVIDGDTVKSTDSEPVNSTSPASEPEGVVSDTAASTNTPNTDTVSGTTATKGVNSTIPNTGPGSYTVVIPLVSIAVGFAVARRRELKNL